MKRSEKEKKLQKIHYTSCAFFEHNITADTETMKEEKKKIEEFLPQ